MNLKYTLALVFPLTLFTSTTLVFADGPADFAEISQAFDRAALPLVRQFCLKCHSTEEQEGDLDLEQFTKLDQVRKAQPIWQKVVEMLDNGEMPPKKSRQLSLVQRNQLRDWAHGYLDAEARANAGDPGPVVLR